jgi:hypothetical protein
VDHPENWAHTSSVSISVMMELLRVDQASAMPDVRINDRQRESGASGDART